MLFREDAILATFGGPPHCITFGLFIRLADDRNQQLNRPGFSGGSNFPVGGAMTSKPTKI